MTAITDKANLEFRDMEAPGSTVPNEPEKLGIRELFALIDVALASLGVNGAITVKKATRALLFADLAHVADTLAVVYNDATSAYNGIYAKDGGSGSGSWSLTALALPGSFGADLAEALAAQETASAAAASATASAAAATAGGAAAVSSAAAAAASAAEAADDAATAAALAGVQRIFNTKALANAGIGSITADAHVIVMVDESQNDRKTLYQKVSGAYVFVIDLDTFSNPIVNGDLTLTDGAVIVPDTLPIRIGDNAMPSLGPDGTYNFPGANIAIGLDAGFSCVEGGMVAVGWEAGYSAGAVGDESAITAVGWKALKLTTTGHATGFGWGVGQRNTTGNMVGVGDESLSFNTTSHSVAVGYYAGHSNVTGSITAVGHQAGRESGPACTMTLVGFDTGYYNTAANLTAVGHRAAGSNTSGSNNTVVGHLGLLANTTGSSLTAIGLNAFYENITGFENTGVGSNVGRSIVSGYQNTFIGTSAGYDASQKTDAINSMALGYGTFTIYDNSVVIGNASITRTTLRGNLGVNGRTNPQFALDVRADNDAGTAANFKNDAGFGLTLRINDGADALGYGANYRHAIQYGGGESLAIAEGTTVRAVVQTSTGNFGIGTTAPGQRLVVSANAGTLPAVVASDAVLGVSGADGDNARLTVDAFGGSPLFSFRRAQGTVASPSAVQSGNILGLFGALGYGATGYSSGRRAGLGFYAAENWTDTDQGTYATIDTTAVGADSSVERVRFTETGVGIATTAPEYALDVAGAIGFTPGASVTPAQNGDVVFELTSNTSLTIKAKGSDGTVRSVVLTLA
jgi:hypothetical protein